MATRDDCRTLDAADRLAPLRDRFALDDADARGLVYLDGNSLGALPRTTAARVQQVVQDEWGRGLIGSWNTAGWIALAQRIGDKIARLVGAGPGEAIVADSTSANLFKALCAALDLARGRNVVLTDEDNFPTDQYIAQSIADQRGLELRRVPAT